MDNLGVAGKTEPTCTNELVQKFLDLQHQRREIVYNAMNTSVGSKRPRSDSRDELEIPPEWRLSGEKAVVTDDGLNKRTMYVATPMSTDTLAKPFNLALPPAIPKL